MSGFGNPHTTCNCGPDFAVTDLESLDYLVNVEGVDALTASRMLWAPELLTGPNAAEPSIDTPRPVALEWARRRGREIVLSGLAGVLGALS